MDLLKDFIIIVLIFFTYSAESFLPLFIAIRFQAFCNTCQCSVCIYAPKFNNLLHLMIYEILYYSDIKICLSSNKR